MARRRSASSRLPRRSRPVDQNRLSRRRLLHESLERRELLAGPELLAIRPDASALLQQGDTLHVAPREFNLLFGGGAQIDEATVNNDSIRLVRSGGDGDFAGGNEVNVELGFVGFVDPGDSDDANRQRIVIRPASSAAHNATDPAFAFPDDTYQIQIIGAGATPLTNDAGEAFNAGVDFAQTFRLDRGGQVVATVPQPVSRNTQRIEYVGNPNGGTFTLSFRGETTDPLNFDATTGDVQQALENLPGSVIRPADILLDGGSGAWEVTFQGHYAGEQVPLMTADFSDITGGEIDVVRTNALSQASDQIVVYFDDQLLDVADATDPQFYRLVNTNATLAGEDDRTTLPQLVTYDPEDHSAVLTFANPIAEGNYRLDVGGSDGEDGAITSAIKVGTLFDGNDYTYNGFLGDVGGQNDDGSDLDLFEVQLAAGSRLDVTLSPHDAALDLSVRLLDDSGAEVTAATVTPGGPGADDLLVFDPVPADGTFFVEVSSADGSTGSYLVDVSVTGNAIPSSDNNTTIDDATDLGMLGAGGITLSSQIEPQNVAMPPYPGGNDEPGHRQIQAERHIGAFGTTPTLPGATTIRTYYFPANLGNDSSGNPYPNLITEEEKQIVRAILELYASYSDYEFVEQAGGTTRIGKGDLRAIDPTLGPNSGVAGKAGFSFVLLNGALFDQANREYGDGFTRVMFHELGHSLGLGHSYDLPSVQGGGVAGDVLPGDHDIVHLQRIHRPDSTDIDLHRFEVAERGRFTAETIAERLSGEGQDSSLLNSVLQLYRQTSSGDVELIASNDNYFGNDAFIDIQLEPGTYFIGVSSTGNTNYDPRVKDSGFGGTTDGDYQLKLSFDAERGGALLDADGTAFDGDADGAPGGVSQFWFQASDSTIFVDKLNDTTANTVDGTGSLADPYDTLDFALRQAGNRIVVPIDGIDRIDDGDHFTINDGLNEVTLEFNLAGGLSGAGSYEVDLTAAVTPNDIAVAIQTAIDDAKTAGDLSSTVGVTVNGPVVQLTSIDNLDISATPSLLTAPNLVRIVGNAGADGELGTLSDNQPYLVGTDGGPLPDGAEFLVPQGVTAMAAAGTLFKMRSANLDVGTSSANISRSHSAIQLLGTPNDPVYLRSYHNDTVGGNSDGVGSPPRAGDFGGIVFREDSDLESEGIFLNYVNHADVNNGGGKVFVDSQQLVFTPIHVIESRPTATFNHISNSADAAMSANPDSFDDALGRIGPDIQGNFLSGNTIDGLFIRIETGLGSRVEKLTVPGRFDDADISHVLTENLQIDGQPGGPEVIAGQRVARSAGRLVVDPGVVLKFSDSRIEAERGSSSLIAEGTPNRPVIFTSIHDDRFGGSGSFDTNGSGFSLGQAGDWSGIVLDHASSASIDHAIITFGGGDSPTEGGSSNFNAIEVHQADLRLTNSLLQSNAGGNASGTRDGRGANAAATIYVRGSQPVVVSNVFRDNGGPVLNINANSLRFENFRDPGRSTGRIDVFGRLADNHGPLVRLNRLEGNAINGMLIRGETLTSESIWDDTDIVHVLNSEVVVGNHHTFSGLRLQSSNTESLVVKLSGGNAGITASGAPLDIHDRIGGTVQVLGTVGHPVVMTDLADDAVGAGLTPDGKIMLDTNNDGNSQGSSGAWRGLVFDEFSNDRNVAIVRELESPLTDGNDVNRTPSTAQFLGTLAPDQKSGDENRRLGFEVKGFISPDDPRDADLYSFRGTAGTEVWLDADRTDPSLDLIIEVINAQGTVLARSVSASSPDNLNAMSMNKELLLGGDYYTQNFRDPGFRYVLPGSTGTAGIYFVRVRSNPASAGSVTSFAGESRGEYQLQIRQQETDEFPGSTVQFADIRYAQTGIDVRGLPAHSPLITEAGELQTTGTGNDTVGGAEQLVNLLQTDMAALGISGSLSNDTDVDWYEFQLDHSNIQFIPGVNDGAGTVSLVFDIDYADGAIRGDTTLAVYDQNQKLVFVGRESNVEDDQPGAGQGSDVDDLSRGSLGKKDPYIGPVHLPVGYENGGAGISNDQLTYYVAVMSNRRLPTQAAQTLLAYPVTNSGTPGDPADRTAQLTRLEPINSLVRVVEDHIGFQGYRSQGAQIDPQTDGIFDISSSITLDNNVRPFSLKDVVLYAATDAAGANDGDRLYTVDPFAGGDYLTRVTGNNWLVNGQNDLQDITMRSDGRLYGYQRLNNDTGTVGVLVEIDPETGAVTPVGNDNILGRTPTPNTRNLANNIDNRADQYTTSDEVDALAFERLGTTGPADAPVPEYDLYYSVRESDNASKLYRARPDGDATAAIPANGNQEYGFLGDIQPAGVTFASYTFNVVDNADPANVTRIRVESKRPGTAGNSIALNISRPNNTNANVTSVSGTTINLQIGGTGGPPTTNGPSASAIVDAINNDEDARALVTAVIVGGNANGQGDGNNGTAAASAPTGLQVLSGGSDDSAVAPVNGRVTGLSFADYFSNSNLFGVTLAGEILEINEDNGNVLKRLDLSAALGTTVRFSGLALGPQNVEGGDYKNTLFAITSDDQLYAIDSEAVENIADPNDPAQVLSVLRPIFDDGMGVAGAISTQVDNMQATAIGLAFSPLDFNLWHPTMKRASDQGHGINDAPDDSRDPGDEDFTIGDPGPAANRDSDQGEGGASFHFGFERYEDNANADSDTYLTYYGGERTQFGILDEAQQIDLSSNANIQGTYNLPGGALGSLQSSNFSLAGYSDEDRPTLYFNYFLETQDHPGSDTDSDDNNPFRDSARVFASRDDGATWELLATNNSRLSPGDASDPRAELPGFLSHLSDAGLNTDGTARPQDEQIVQELFDNTGEWRQARVDLSTYAGDGNIQLRFDFSTAGAVDDSTLDIAGNDFGELSRDTRSIRSLDNSHEGFYVDDIIVGFAERGEMVTGPNNPAITQTTDLNSNTRTNRNRDPDANPIILAGRYQLEARRAGEYVGLLDDGVTIDTTYDTNDRHIVSSTETANIDFEGIVPSLTTPSTITIRNETYNAGDIFPWTVSTNAYDGSFALESSDIFNNDVAVFQAKLSDLTGGNTSAGNIRFLYSVSSESFFDGLSFLIDGVEQRILDEPGEITSGSSASRFASGEIPYRVAQLPFGSGDHTLTWAYSKDFIFSSGFDRALIDNVQILQGGTGLAGDRNRERPQGVFIIDSNFIRDSSVRGINVDAGTDEAGGNVPHQGPTINFPQTDPSRLIPGVVIQNNVIADSSGVRFSGHDSADPQTPVPFGKIVNNTFVGDGGGIGVEIGANASPTVMNNIFASYDTAIVNNSGGASPEIRSNFFQENTNNGPVGTDAILVSGSPALFVDAANGNYYLAPGSQAVDSSLNTLQDRFNYANFKNALGIPPSPLVAPDRDVFGQLRVDSGASPGGGGSSVFKDRGAVDRADFDAPFAELIVPVDNDAEGNDSDPNTTIVWQKDPFLEGFSILLSDGPGPNSPFEGTGVDGLTVDDPANDAISQQAVKITQNGQPLTEGVDYELGYNSLTGVLSLTPLATLWEPQSVYVITLDNTQIDDLAGNALRSNRPDGSTRFTILLGDFDFDYGDAPNSYGTLLASNGARHILSANDLIHLGAVVDAETNGQPSAAANGDDLNGDDEDGVPVGAYDSGSTVATGLILEPGSGDATTDADQVAGFLNPRDQAFGTPITVNVTGSGLLDAWVDYNNNGVFTDPGEQILDDHPVVDGANQITVFAPAGTSNGLKNARFRVSTAGVLQPTGLSITGEVEDYQLRVANVNLPVPQNASFGLDEDTQVSGTLPPPTLPLSPTVDPSTLQYQIIDAPQFQPAFTLNADGSFTYTPGEDFYGTDTFTYRVAGEAVVDGLDLPVRSTGIGTVTFTVNPINDAPTAEDHAFITIEPSSTSGPTAVTISEAQLLTNALVQDDTDLRSAPFDEKEQSLTVVQIRVRDNTGTLTPVLTEADGSPLADPFLPVDGVYTADTYVEGVVSGSLTVTVAGNAVTEVVYQPADQYNEDNPQNGVLATLDGFEYTVADDGATTLPNGDPASPQPAPEFVDASVTIQVYPSNDAPIAGDDAIPGTAWNGAVPTEDTTLSIPRSFLLANDAVAPMGADDELSGVDGNDGSLFLVTDSAVLDTLQPGLAFPLMTAQGGTVSIDPNNGDLVYTPAADYYGPDSFSYWVVDEGINEDTSGVRTNNPLYGEATVSLVVDPVNDVPTAIDHSRVILEDESVTVTAADLLTDAAAHFDPQNTSAPWDETNQVLRVASLSIGGVTIDSTGTFATPHGSVDATFVTTPAGLALEELTYTPDTHFDVDNPLTDMGGMMLRTLETFTYTVFDDGLAVLPQDPAGTPVSQTPLSVTNTLTIEVKPQNDAPVAGDDVIPGVSWGGANPTEDTDLTIPRSFLLANDAVGPAGADDELNGVNGNDGTKFIVTDPAILDTLSAGLTFPLTTAEGGTVAIDPTSGDLVYSPAADYYGPDSFTYWVGDEGVDEAVDGARTDNPLYTEATVSLVVDPVNDVPTAVDHSRVILEEGSVTVTGAELLAGAAAHFDPQIMSSPWDETNQELRVASLSIGGVTIDSTGTFATPHGSVDATFVSTAAGLDLEEMTYTPDQHFNVDNPLTDDGGSFIRTLETFTYTVFDDGLAVLPQDLNGTPVAQNPLSVTNTLTIEVKPQNDAPVAGDDAIPGSAWTGANPTEDTDLVIPRSFLLANDAVGPAGADDELNGVNGNDGTKFVVTDPAILDSLSAGLAFPLTTPQGGTVSIDQNTGDLIYSPAADYYGPDSFTYWVGDEGVNEDTSGVRTDSPLYTEATVSLVVDPVNDLPTAGNHSRVVLEEGAVTVTGSELLAGAAAHFDPQIPSSPWDETNQALRVSSLSIGGVTIDSSGSYATPHGSVEATFTSTAAGLALDELTYTPDEHFNVDNPLTDDAGSLIRTLESFTFTVFDDGLAVLPQDPNGTPVAQTPLSVTASLTIEVKPQNDAPVASDDAIPGIDWTGANPTEDTDLVIPRSFLLANDAVGPLGADDELNGVNANDGTKFIVTDPAILDTLSSGLTFPLTTAEGGTVAIDPSSGDFVFSPAADYYGPDSFTYWVGDEGVDEAVDGTRTDHPRYTEATVSLIVDPVNDVPTSVDHSRVILEGDSVTVTAAELLTGAAAHFDPQILSAPWDETNQQLRVASLSIGGVTIDASGTFATPHGSVEATFVATASGFALDELTYTPDPFFNVDNPRTNDAGTLIRTLETFTYTVFDDGQAVLPQDPNGTPRSQAPLSTTASLTIEVKPQNDAPVAGDDAIPGLAWDQFDPNAPNPTEDTTLVISPTFLLQNDAVAPVGANDEINGINGNDGTRFLVTDSALLNSLMPGLSFPLTTAEGGQVAFNSSTGNLEYTPAADYYGPDSFTYWVGDEGIDEAVDGTRTANPRFTEATVSLVVDPVNDQPSASDHSYVILEDGAITLTAEEMLGGNLNLLNGAAEHNNPQIQASPWDEVNQNLRVSGVTVAGFFITASNASAGPFATSNGMLEVVFDGNALQSLTFTPNANFNVDNPLTDPNGSAIRTLESFTYTVSDDGLAVLPQDPNGPAVQQPEETAVGTVSIEVKPQNDPPLANGEAIPSLAWTTFDPNGPNPTEDTTLVIPSAFLLNNDSVGPLGANDELDGVNNNDGAKFLVTDSAVLDSLQSGLSFPLTTTRGGQVAFNATTGDLEYTPPADYYGTDSFTYWVGDEGLDEAVDGTRTANPKYAQATLSLTVDPVNDAPAAIDHQQTMLEDGSLTLPASQLLLGAVEHANPQRAGFPWNETNQSLRIISIHADGTEINSANADDGPFATEHGSLTVQFNGTSVSRVIYTPDEHFNADNPAAAAVPAMDQFTYTVADDGLAILPQNLGGPQVQQPMETATATVTIDVKPRNDAPIATDDVIPGAAWSSFDANAADPTEDETLVIPTAFLLQNDVVAPLGANDELPPASINDGAATLVTNSAILNTLGSGNTFPLTTAQGGTVQFNATSGNLEYTPAANFFGTDSFTYWMSDEGIDEGLTGTQTDNPRYAKATVVLTVATVNDPPEFSGAPSVSVGEDAGESNPTVPPGDVGLSTFPNWATNILPGPIDEQNEPQTVEFLIQPLDATQDSLARNIFRTDGNGHLMVSADANGTLQFRTLADANGAAVFSVVARDNAGAETAPRTFTITVNAVNDPPTFNSGPVVSVDEDSAAYSQVWATNILPGPFDEQNEPQTVTRFEVDTPADVQSLFSVQPAMDTAGVLTFTPAADASGSATITVRAFDSNGLASAPATLTINIAPLPDAPVSGDDIGNVDEDNPVVLTRSLLLSNDSDADLPADSLTLILGSSTSTRGAAISLNADGDVLYNPSGAAALQALAAGETDSDSFTYQLEDSTGRRSNVATVSLTVSGLNDAPQPQNDQFLVRFTGSTTLQPLQNDSDVDGQIDPSSVVVTTQPTSGSLSVQDDGSFVYTPFANFQGSDTIQYTVADELGQQSKQATITISADPSPLAIDDAGQGYGANAVDVAVLGNDSASVGQLDPAALNITAQPQNGTVSIQSDGTLRYQPAPGFFGSDTFRYTIADTLGNVSSEATVSIEIEQSPYQNPVIHTDVNGDGETNAIDALRVINLLNRFGLNVPVDTLAYTPPDFVDTNGDGLVQPLDALLVISEMNRQQRGTASGEGERFATEPRPTVSPLEPTHRPDQVFELRQRDLALLEDFDDAQANASIKWCEAGSEEGSERDAAITVLSEGEAGDAREYADAADEAIADWLEDRF